MYEFIQCIFLFVFFCIFVLIICIVCRKTSQKRFGEPIDLYRTTVFSNGMWASVAPALCTLSINTRLVRMLSSTVDEKMVSV